jgi:hypothetical protein
MDSTRDFTINIQNMESTWRVSQFLPTKNIPTVMYSAHSCSVHCTNKSYPITGLDRPLGLKEVEALRFFTQFTHKYGKVVSPTHRPRLPPKTAMGNQTRKLPACSAVPQPTASPRASCQTCTVTFDKVQQYYINSHTQTQIQNLTMETYILS